MPVIFIDYEIPNSELQLSSFPYFSFSEHVTSPTIRSEGNRYFKNTPNPLALVAEAARARPVVVEVLINLNEAL